MLKRRHYRTLAAVLFLMLAPVYVLTRSALSAGTNTITVDNTTDPAKTSGNGFCTLREAINNANHPGADTTGGDCAVGTGIDRIIFSVNGTIILSSSLPAIINKLTIDGSGQTVTVDGVKSFRPFSVNTGAQGFINDLTIVNGLSPAEANGGGIFNMGTLTVTNCTLSGNSSPFGFGGGINNFSGGTLTVINSTFSNNTASSSGLGGGGIGNSGTASVSNSTFRNNSAVAGIGGGINNDGTLTVTDSTLSGNSAQFGGGIENSGALTVTSSTFSGNTAAPNGGGIDNPLGTVTVTNSTFFGNVANHPPGGSSAGGAIQNGFHLTVTNSTFSGNAAVVGGGIFTGGTGSASTVNNSAFSTDSGGNCSGTIINGGFNTADDKTCIFGTSTGANGQTVGDGISPQLDPKGLQNNGGPTQTIALQSTSPAIDAILPVACPPTDQRGAARPDPEDVGTDNQGCDIGAFESGGVVPTPTPTQTAKPTFTPTIMLTPTFTQTATPTFTQTATPTFTPTVTKTEAHSPTPTPTAVISQGLWVANSGGPNVLQFLAAGGVVNGAPHSMNSSASFVSPQDAVFDKGGNMWVVDGGKNGVGAAVYEFTGAQLLNLVKNPAPAPVLTISNLSGGVGFMFPHFAAFDDLGNLWVSDSGNNTIFKFATGQLAPALTGTVNAAGPAPAAALTSAAFNAPTGIAFDASRNLWISNNGGATIVEIAAFVVDQASGQTQVAPNSTLNSDEAAVPSINNPSGILFDPSGNLWLANEQRTAPTRAPGGTIVEFTSASIAGGGNITPPPNVTLTGIAIGGASSLDGPNGIAMNSVGDLSVANTANNAIAVYAANQVASSGNPAPALFFAGAATMLKAPAGVVFAQASFVIPTPTPTPSASPTPTPSPTSGIVKATAPTPVPMNGVLGGKADGGKLTIHNGTADTVTISSVTIKFSNADLFTSTTLTGSAPSQPSQVVQFMPPLDNGAGNPTNNTYVFAKSFVLQSGQDAVFQLNLTITTTPQITMRTIRTIYAGVFGGGRIPPGLGVLSGVLMLLSLCTAGLGSSRRRIILALLILILVAASQVGCDNGSVPGSTSAPLMSAQSATAAGAMDERTKKAIDVAGLSENSPLPLSTIVVPTQ